MKTKLLTLSLLLTGLAFVNAADKDKHDHDHGAKTGPTGGRLIQKIEPHAEFFVNKDKKIEIRFVDHDNKVVAPGNPAVTVTMGDRSAPTRLAFVKEGNKLVSDKVIPDGNDLPTVVQIKATPDSKTVTEKFNLNLAKCPTCKYQEYACACDHGDEKK